MEKSFARKLSWKPLFNSVIFGAGIGTFVYIISKNDLFSGVTWGLFSFFVQSMAVYPRYLPSLYGRWRITSNHVYYYDYSTWTKRIKAIFLPIAKKQNVISFDDIMSYSLVVTQKSNHWTPHYIILKVDDGHDIALDLSWNLLKSGAPQKDIEWVVDFITTKLNQKTVKVLQA